MKLSLYIRTTFFLSLFILYEIDQGESSGIIPSSVNACEIKKLVVRVTRVIYTLYGDNTEPPVTKVRINYYDPEGKKAKKFGETNWNTNGRSLYPLWDEADGTIESEDNPKIL
jgi:hypothetical protein